VLTEFSVSLVVLTETYVNLVMWDASRRKFLTVLSHALFFVMKRDSLSIKILRDHEDFTSGRGATRVYSARKILLPHIGLNFFTGLISFRVFMN
jgi:hypothetical protein